MLDPTSHNLEPLIKRDGWHYGAEDIAKANTALEAANGNRKSAAEILGITEGQLRSFIDTTPELNRRWVKSVSNDKQGIVEADGTASIARATPRELALTEDERRAVALQVHERKMRYSLSRLGFKTTEIDAITAVEEFAGQHFKNTLNTLHGAMLKSAMRLMLQAERIESTYLQDDELSDKDRKWWWDVYFEIIEKLRLMNGEANKAALTKALIEGKKNGKEVKPGYTVPSVAIQINGATTVKTAPESAGKTGEPDPTT